MALYVSLTCYGKHRPFPQDTSALRHALSPKGLTHDEFNIHARSEEARGEARGSTLLATVVVLVHITIIISWNLTSGTFSSAAGVEPLGLSHDQSSHTLGATPKQHNVSFFALCNVSIRFRKFWRPVLTPQAKSHTPNSIGDQPSTHILIRRIELIPFSLTGRRKSWIPPSQPKSCPPVGRASSTPTAPKCRSLPA